MKVYIVISFKKDYPNSLEVYATREAAEKAAGELDCFTTITTKVVKS